MNISPSFGKTLKAVCQLRMADNQPKTCQIYHLDKKKDRGYFSKLLGESGWENSKYASIMNALMQTPATNSEAKAYAIEVSNGQCVGFVRTQDKGSVTQVDYIETAPRQRSTNKSRKIKNIGQTLMAFVISEAQKDGKQAVFIPYPAQSAIPFYKNKFNFRQIEPSEKKLILEEQNFDKSLRKYQANTASRISLIG